MTHVKTVEPEKALVGPGTVGPPRIEHEGETFEHAEDAVTAKEARTLKNQTLRTRGIEDAIVVKYQPPIRNVDSRAKRFGIYKRGSKSPGASIGIF